MTARHPTRRRAAGWALAALVLTSAASLPAPATASTSGAPCAVPAGEGWTSTPAPDLSAYENAYYADSAELVAHALDRGRPQDRWVASPAAVVASRDGGCTWTEAVALPDVPTPELPVSAAVHRLEQLLAGRTDRDAQRVVSLGRSFAQEVVVLRSDDGGAQGSWQAHPQPQLTGNLLGATMAPSDADRLYAAIDRGVVALLEVHVSDDGGRTWALTGSLDVAGQRTPGAIGDAVLAVDPENADTVFLSANDSGVLRSTDAGRTWTRLDGPRKAGGLSVHRDGAALSVVASDRADALVRVSPDAGSSWTERGTGAPKPFRRLRHGLSPDRLLAVQGPSAPRFYDEVGMSVWRWDAAAGGFLDITPDGAPLLYDAALADDGSFVLHGPQGLWTWHGDRPPPPDAGTAPAPTVGGAGTRLLPASPPPPEPARLTVPQRLVLRPGERRTVEVGLDVPPRPRDLDLVLLFDTTNSMSGTIDALRAEAQGLVDALAAGGSRARFGVAEFQDYPLAPYGQPASRAYARLRDLAPVDAALDGHLAALSTRDDLDVQTSGLTGLLQLATGAGQTGLPRAPQSEDPNLPARQGMSFAPGAVRVVVTFADEPFHDSPAHPGPSLAQTVDALTEQGVLAVGVAVGGRPAGAGPDLRRVAAGTGALAPVDVDCGGSALPAGAPLVCDLDAEGLRLDRSGPGGGLVEAVTALVQAVPARTVASLEATAPDGLQAQAGPAAAVDLRRQSGASFPVTVGCTGATGGAVALTARVGSDVVARAELPVVCGDVAPAAPARGIGAAAVPAAGTPVAAGPVTEAPAGALAAAPPAAPPPVVQVPAPAPAAQAAPGSATSGAAGSAPAGAGAPGDAASVQAALAGAPEDVAPGRARAYVDGRSSEVPLAAVPLAGGLLVTAAATTHLLAARRRPPAPVVVRPSRRSGEPR